MRRFSPSLLQYILRNINVATDEVIAPDKTVRWTVREISMQSWSEDELQYIFVCGTTQVGPAEQSTVTIYSIFIFEY